MKNKKMISLVVGFVVVALVFFLIGSSYGKGKALVVGNVGQLGQMRSGGTGGGFTGGQRGGRAGGGNVFGTILSKDANSITVELRSMGPNNGTAQNVAQGSGSKIVFYTNKTIVAKTVDGTLADLVVGKAVSVSGTANPDGSVNADSIQLRTVPVVQVKTQ